MISENMDKFGKISVGIHAKELPKYGDKASPEDKREWWKQFNGYVNSPIHQSAKLLKIE
jgi:hypothetical protein